MKELLAIQAELKAPKNQFNNFGKYKYRNQEDILEAVKPLLKKHDCLLTLSDEVKEIGNITYIEATARIYKAKDSLDGIMEGVTSTAQAGIDPTKKGMDLAQCFGSSSSYARKYALNGLFLIDDTKDSDSINEHNKAESYAINKIESLLRTSSISQKDRENISKKMQRFNQEEADKCIQYLKDNQVSAIQSGNNYGAKEINVELDNKMNDEKA